MSSTTATATGTTEPVAPEIKFLGKGEEESLKQQLIYFERCVSGGQSLGFVMNHWVALLNTVMAAPDQVSEASYDFILRKSFPSTVKTYLRNISDPGSALNFLRFALEFAINHYHLLIPELLDVPNDILTPSSDIFKFHDRVRVADDFRAHEAINSKAERESGYYVRVLSLFWSSNAVPTIKDLFQKPEVPLASKKILLKTFVKIRNFVHAKALEEHALFFKDEYVKFLTSLPDEELKNYDKNLLTDCLYMIESILTTLDLSDEFSSELDRLNLEISFKFFSFKILSQRLAGLNDIKNLITKSEHHTKLMQMDDDESYWLTVKTMTEWFRANNFIELLYDSKRHPELIKRSSEIANFLAQNDGLTTEDIDIMWDKNMNKHESEVLIIYSNFMSLSQHLNYDLIDHLYQKIKKIHFDHYDTNLLQLINSLTIAGIRVAFTKETQNFFGVELLWDFILYSENDDLVLDESKIQRLSDMRTQAQSYLEYFIEWEHCQSLREPLMLRCLENIKNSRSTLSSIAILTTINTASLGNRQNGPKAISKLIEEHDLVGVLFSNLLRYKATAQSKVAHLEVNAQTDWGPSKLVGNFYTHSHQINERLNFLRYLLNSSPSFQLSIEQINLLWNSLFLNPLYPDEVEFGYRFLDQPISIGMNRDHWLTDEGLEHIFFNKFPTVNLAPISNVALNTFRLYFVEVNRTKNKIFSDDKLNITVFDNNIIGLDLIWNIVLEATNKLVGKHAILFLTKIQRSIENEASSKEQILEIRHRFLNGIFQELNNSHSKIEANGGSVTKPLKLRIQRCLNVLNKYINEFEPISSVLKKHGSTKRGRPIKVDVPIFQTSVDAFSKETVGVLRQKIATAINELPQNIRIFTTTGTELKVLTQQLQSVFVHSGARVTVNCVRLLNRKANPAPSIMNKPFIDESCYPSVIVANNYFNFLFQFLSLSDNFLRQTVWDLLMILPTNQQMSHLPSSSSASAPNWTETLVANNTFKLLYTLQIVEFMALENDGDSQAEKEAKQAWRSWFISTKGFRQIIHVSFSSALLATEQDEFQKRCFSLLMKLIRKFSIKDVEKELPQIIDDSLFTAVNDPKLLISQLLNIVSQTSNSPGGSGSLSDSSSSSSSGAASNAPPIPPRFGQPQSQIQKYNASIVKHTLHILVAACALNQDYLMALIQADNIYDFISNAVVHTSALHIRRASSNHFHRLSQMNESFQKFLFRTCIQIYQTISPDVATSDDFFDLFDRLTLETDPKTLSEAEVLDLCNLTIAKLKSQPAESRGSSSYNSVFVGILCVFKTFLGRYEHLKHYVGQTAGMIQEIYQTFLFDIPSAENHGLDAPPKCKSKVTRYSAFQVLVELGSERTNFLDLVSRLLQHHNSQSEPDTFNFSPQGLEKSPTGYVGLRNLGATCYMNSLMQQLYMIPNFRKAILSTTTEYKDFLAQCSVSSAAGGSDTAQQHLTSPTAAAAGPIVGPVHEGVLPLANSEDDKFYDNTMFQFQKIFSYLQESEMKYIDTQGFCKSYKDYDDQPVDPRVQMDADEFFNMFFDKIETHLRDTNQPNFLKELFESQSTSFIESETCAHRSERTENHFTIGLTVKGKQSLLESLELHIEGDHLNGDNKYKCEECGYVDAVKRTCVKTLPNNLIIHLRRFEYDVELQRRAKVNDRITFPIDKLNMEPYTMEGIRRREAERKGLPLPDPVHPASYYEYELAGILVHSGTADSGHYYSFIKERVPRHPGQPRKWYQFNDTVVEPFDPEEIPTCCFGGFEEAQVYDVTLGRFTTQTRQRIDSAYMLIYQRIVPIQPTPALSLSEVAQSVAMIDVSEQDSDQSHMDYSKYIDPVVYKQVWRENMKYLREKDIFETDYFSFLWDLVTIQKYSDPVLSYSPGSQDFTENVEQDPLLSAIQLGTKFFLHSYSHSHEKNRLDSFARGLGDLFAKHIPACKWFFHYITTEPNLLHRLFFVCYLPATRDIIVTLINRVLSILAPYERALYPAIVEGSADNLPPLPDPQSYAEAYDRYFMVPRGEPLSFIVRFVNKYLSMMREARFNWRNFSQYFLLLRQFAALGPHEVNVLLQRKVITQLVDFYLGDESPLSKNFGQRPPIRDQYAVGNTTFLLSTIALMVRECVPEAFARKKSEEDDKEALPSASAPAVVPAVEPVPAPLLRLSDEDRSSLNYSFLHFRWITDNMNPLAGVDITAAVAWNQPGVSTSLFDNAQRIMSYQVNLESFTGCFDAVATMLRLQDEYHRMRVEYFCNTLVVSASSFLLSNDYVPLLLMRLLKEMVAEDALMFQFLFENISTFLEPLLVTHKYDAVRQATEQLLYAFTTSPLLPPDDQQRIRAAIMEKLFELQPHLRKYIVKEVLSHYPKLPASSQVSSGSGTGGSSPAIGPQRPPGATSGGSGSGSGSGGSSVFVSCKVWNLSSFYSLMRRYMSDSDAFFDRFVDRFDDFFGSLAYTDQLQIDLDENKQEMVVLLEMILEKRPDLRVRLVTEHDLTALSRFYVCVKTVESYYSFNSYSTPKFYRIVLWLGEVSDTFLLSFAESYHLKWATRCLCLAEDHYDPAVVLFDLIRLIYQKFESVRRTYIGELIEYDRRLSYSSFAAFKLLDLLLLTDNDILVFCRGKGLDMVNQRLELFSLHVGHFDVTRALLISSALPALLKIIRWFMGGDGLHGAISVPATLPIKEQLASEWKEKSKIAALIVDSFLIDRPEDALKTLSSSQAQVTPSISENECPPRTYEVLMGLCQIDSNALADLFRRLHNDHSLFYSASVSRPKLRVLLNPSSLPFTELQRYYQFIQNLCTLALQRLDQTSDVQRTINQMLMVVNEVKASPVLSAPVLGWLVNLQRFDAEIVAHSTVAINYVVENLANSPLLNLKEFRQFLALSFPLMVEKFEDEHRVRLAQLIHSALDLADETVEVANVLYIEFLVKLMKIDASVSQVLPLDRLRRLCERAPAETDNLLALL